MKKGRKVTRRPSMEEPRPKPPHNPANSYGGGQGGAPLWGQPQSQEASFYDQQRWNSMGGGGTEARQTANKIRAAFPVRNALEYNAGQRGMPMASILPPVDLNIDMHAHQMNAPREQRNENFRLQREAEQEAMRQFLMQLFGIEM